MNESNNLIKAKQLKFILGDQLNIMHSWFEHVNDDVIYVIAEREFSFSTSR